jgi:hypothetical protein
MSTTTVHLNNDEDDNNHFESKSTLVCFYFLIIKRKFFFFFKILFLKIKTDSPSSKRSLSPPPKDMLKEHIRVISGCATNILSSIGIIFLNKYIFSHCQIKTMTLTAIQMAFTSLGLVQLLLVYVHIQ